ncbi:helicase-associated domain-containing protein [Streptomyces abyssomicinicus]|uniref:helicase-associated domain-containing protein n=1 Tax=Streptomyces abyssomicinicus TaxID=574929 RepID=UPI0012501FE5|nr:helicase-associated domain-containing protein [Streptomyces abyssomicinicus]
MSTEEKPAATPRSLAEALRARDDVSLSALLRARPDLVSPVPTDLTQLATRAGTRASVARALERLDRFTLQTAEALAVASDPASYDELLRLMAGEQGDDPEAAASPVVRALPHAVDKLREQALVWGDDARLRLVRTARELMAPTPRHPSPTGLGPTVAEAAVPMSPNRVQDILAAAGLSSTHDAVSAVTALTELFTDPQRMSDLLSDAPADSLEILDRLVWGPPYGQVTHDPAPRLRWLMDRGLLLPIAPGTVVLPREVALHLRGGRAHRVTEPLPSAVRAAARHAPQVVDATAAGQAYQALVTVEDLLKLWDGGGPAVLRAGGLSVRDLKRTSVSLGVSEPEAAFWLEIAFGAGLLASDGEADERYAPTPASDEWLDRPPAERWARLAQAWLTATRTPGVVGGRDAKDRALSALGAGLDRSAAPEVRHRVLTLLASLPAGSAPDERSLLDRLQWERPLRRADGTAGSSGGPSGGEEDLRTRLARWTLEEAERLGVTGRGALASHGRALVLGEAPERGREPLREAEAEPGPTADTGVGQADSWAGQADSWAAPADAGPGDKLPVHRHLNANATGRPDPVPAPLPPAEQAAAADTAAQVLTPLLPAPLDHVLLQADLTAVAPGPLVRPLAEMLDVLAEVESKGGATVYRFTPGSVRRALDSGRTAADLHAFLAAHARTPVPQPLAYLIDDVARRHGVLRVGACSSYVRCDDEKVLEEILADGRSHGLGLRRLAPTVLAARTDPSTLLEGLRSMGFAPAAESSEGDVLVARAAAHRTPPRALPQPVPEGPPTPDGVQLSAAVRAIRAGDAAATAPLKTPEVPEGDLPRTSAADTLATLQMAVMTGTRVLIGHLNAEGVATQRVLTPLSVEGGFVTAHDHTAAGVRTYPLHRVTGAAELADDDA